MDNPLLATEPTPLFHTGGCRVDRLRAGHFVATASSRCRCQRRSHLDSRLASRTSQAQRKRHRKARGLNDPPSSVYQQSGPVNNHHLSSCIFIDRLASQPELEAGEHLRVFCNECTWQWAKKIGTSYEKAKELRRQSLNPR